MTKKEREHRIIARGEFSNHSHVIVGDAEIITEDGKTLIEVQEEGMAYIKHILETHWVDEGKEVWTGEHEDIQLAPGKYEFIQQSEYDPFEKVIRQVRD